MASPARAPRKSAAIKDANTRFDRRLAEILEHATGVFYEKGYAGASMRDLSRATGMSLAGLYYYFDSKEKLLYLIQKHTFQTILDRLQQRLAGVRDTEERVRLLIATHLEYFLANQKGMKVLSHEMGVLKNSMRDEIRAIKRQYYQTGAALVEALKAERGIEFPTRTAVLSLFGMMNWIYTWYRAGFDPEAGELARRMGDIFLHGLMGAAPKREIMASAERLKPAAHKRRTASSKG